MRWAVLMVLVLGMQSVAAQAAPLIAHRIEASYPHDPGAYTQGLVWYQGALYESTGLRGRSSLRKTRLRDGRVIRLRSLEPSLFAEGIAIADGHILQLTWTSQILLRYRLGNFSLVDRSAYLHQGWGLAVDGKRFIVSDGTATLRFLDADSLAVVDEIEVVDGDQPVQNLNELEFIDGLLFANIWQSTRIARINTQTGAVTGWLDLSDLVSKVTADNDRAEVLNGIAWRPDTRQLLVTGKFWPYVYALRLLD